jgi:hypothetical protein
MKKAERALVQLLVYIGRHEKETLNRLARTRQFAEACSAVGNELMQLPEAERDLLAKPELSMDEAEEYTLAAFEEMMVAHEARRQALIMLATAQNEARSAERRLQRIRTITK